jgi:hypothetical protein
MRAGRHAYAISYSAIDEANCALRLRLTALVCPTQNGIVDRAFEYVELDEARLYVKLLAIWRTHRLQSPV